MKLQLTFVVALLAAGCSSVPTLVFGEPDAATDGGKDAGRDAATDATRGCPAVGPDGGMCCGSVSCMGSGCAQACAECQMKCAATQLCCPNPGGKVQSCENAGVCP